MEFSTNFDYLIPVKTIGFELGAMLAGDSVTINLSGYYNQGKTVFMSDGVTVADTTELQATGA